MGRGTDVRSDDAVTEIHPPEVCRTPDGRIGVFMGTAYRYMSLDVARRHIENLQAVVEDAERMIGAAR
jgi:hypothetical protein